MEFLFGHRMTPKEMLRKQQRALNHSIRELDRERMHMQQQEKKTISEIRLLAQKGQMNAARIMAKDLVRIRQNVQKFYEMRAELQAVSLRLVTLKSTATMSDAMKGAAKAMMSMNKQINLPAMQKIMFEFEKQSEVMEMKQEMMTDTMEGMNSAENEDAETEEVVNKVLDEIGIDLEGRLADAPEAGVPVAAEVPVRTAVAADVSGGGGGAAPAAGGGSLDGDLQARLDALKRQ
eukprot:TRINITY_DN2229_c0_g1_i3.p1 TRINITY_DN2229_c0_g1~~TRINITY_DN2229_c0_g1_i3.p1  ORF type:complete len:255 (-),score=93.61 TRINITY_DN2229_c0_g1_i3:729-1430(-)